MATSISPFSDSDAMIAAVLAPWNECHERWCRVRQKEIGDNDSYYMVMAGATVFWSDKSDNALISTDIRYLLVIHSKEKHDIICRAGTLNEDFGKYEEETEAALKGITEHFDLDEFPFHTPIHPMNMALYTNTLIRIYMEKGYQYCDMLKVGPGINILAVIKEYEIKKKSDLDFLPKMASLDRGIMEMQGGSKTLTVRGLRGLCTYCGKRPSSRKRCGSCKKAYYCDLKCQRLDWREHKKLCSFSKT